MTPFVKFSALRAALAIGALTLAASAPAQAIVYSFTFTGGAKPEVAFASSYLFVEVTENSTTPANDVSFKFTNEIPVLNPDLPPSIARLYFDTGSYTSLFTGMSITETTGLVNLVPKTPAPHPFLPSNFTPDYQFGLSSTYPLDNPKYGINPGESATLTATLSAGKSFADVIGAMNQGINAATASTGLRIGVFTYFNLGTMRDDGAFVTHGVVAVPEAETWAMMLAGLGLMGFMVHRRKG
jgi:hypothetical protein